jgi:hypothetical protein
MGKEQRTGLVSLTCRVVAWVAPLVLGALVAAAPARAQAPGAPVSAQPAASTSGQPVTAPPTRSLPRPASNDGRQSTTESPPSTTERGLLTAPPQAAAPQQAEIKLRHALVIGNSAYPQSPLRNPKNDAQAMAEKLAQLQWSVTPVLDADERRMRDALTEFGHKLRNGDDALVYYAGHGVQINGVNYLVPVDARFATQLDIKNHALSLNDVMEMLRERAEGVNVVILDACRDNPLPAGDRSTARGLAAAARASNTWIAYATSPNSVASDGTGPHGTYTTALLNYIGSEAPVYEMFIQVRNAVLEATNNQQEPWDEGSLRDPSFRIVPYDEPLAVKHNGSGTFVVRERRTARTHELSTQLTPGEVRALALLSYQKNANDWWSWLDRSVARLDEAVALQGKLDEVLVKMQQDPGCIADRQRLTQTRLKVMDHRANINPEAMLEALEPALDRAPRESCDVGRFPWRDVTLAAIGSAVLGTAIAGTIYYSSARATWKDAQKSCPDGQCPDDGSLGPRQSRDAKADADRATLFYSFGVVALAGMAATYFLWPDPHSEAAPERAAHPRFELGVSSEGSWASAAFSF